MKYMLLMRDLALRLSQKKNTLQAILQDYQTHEVTEYEIERCLRTIDGLAANDKYLATTKKIDTAAIMLPSNLPLYSLVIFAAIPSLLSEHVYVRPNSILQEHNIISRIGEALDLENLFPGISIINGDHAAFEVYLKKADLVVFTGKPANAEKLLSAMKVNSALVINGAGHNPLVVTETADIDAAVKGSLLVKGFNGGQDCAGPDAILVHRTVANSFVQKFQTEFSQLKTGSFKDAKTVIGPIHRFSELQRLAALLNANSKDILVGGTIDYKNNIVHPTTIVRSIKRYPNFQEVYGPFAFIHPYDSDEDLKYYFRDADGHYNANRMYVTVYGDSQYVAERDDEVNPGKPGNVGIVLKNLTVHDVEIGYKAYGGYSMGASGVIKKTDSGIKRAAMPILLPQIIVDYLIKGIELPNFAEVKPSEARPIKSTLKKESEISPIVNDFHNLVQQVFKDNVNFCFIFGSAAKGNLKVQGEDRDDLDTFVCLKEEDPNAIAEFQKGLAELHHKYNLKVDDEYPAEVMSLARLEQAIKSASQFDVSIDKPVEGTDYDNLFWVHAISDKKLGFAGDGKLVSSLVKKASTNIFKWKDQILTQIGQAENLPDHLHAKFPGLDKKAILDKLSKLSPHLIVHLGLRYGNEYQVSTAISPVNLHVKPGSHNNESKYAIRFFDENLLCAQTVNAFEKMSIQLP